jgi:hypothetical protein
MANVVGVIGSTGTGKSTAIKTLNPKETYIINVLGKRLPFKGSASIYKSEGEDKNIINISEWDMVLKCVGKDGIIKSKPHVKNIIIDDIRHIMEEEFFKRAGETGFTKFGQMGQHMQQVIQACTDLPQDLNVFLMFHDDDVYNNGAIYTKKIRLVGKMMEDHYNPLEVFSVCLFTNVDLGKEGKPTYNFVTNRTLVDGVIIPAKSPEGMFKSIKIPNDLQLVVNAMKEYYE